MNGCKFCKSSVGEFCPFSGTQGKPNAGDVSLCSLFQTKDARSQRLGIRKGIGCISDLCVPAVCTFIFLVAVLILFFPENTNFK